LLRLRDSPVAHEAPEAGLEGGPAVAEPLEDLLLAALDVSVELDSDLLGERPPDRDEVFLEELPSDDLLQAVADRPGSQSGSSASSSRSLKCRGARP
jgi:hypothetical protein